MSSGTRTYSSRESALIFYRAAQHQDDTWWLRSLRLAQVPTGLVHGDGRLNLLQLEEVAEGAGLDPTHVRRAAEALSGAGQEERWRASTT